MLKRDRSPEEKRWDDMLRVGLRLLGENPSETPSETVNRSEVAEDLKPPKFSQYLAWDRWGRKGQRCRIVNPNATGASRVQIEFEDGFIATISRFAIRRNQ